MVKKVYAGVSGAFLTALVLVVGLWANYVISGDILRLVSGSGTIAHLVSVLFMSLFVGLSGGHYIGGSFKDGQGRRAFAIGANAVLWLFLISVIGFQISGGGGVVEPLLYTAVLVFSSGGLFTLHRSDLIEDQSRVDMYIGLFSSKGTAAVVTATLVVRTAPDPAIAFAAVVVALGAGALILNAYGDQVAEYQKLFDDKINDLRTSDSSSWNQEGR